MQSRTTQRFRERYGDLPENVQERTRKSYRLWKNNPQHPSLNFKKVHPTDPVYSARVGLSYRVVGLKRDDGMV